MQCRHIEAPPLVKTDGMGVALLCSTRTPLISNSRQSYLSSRLKMLAPFRNSSLCTTAPSAQQKFSVQNICKAGVFIHDS
jgi:hypothetical protein